MQTKSKYKTKQREKLLQYIERIPGTHFSAGDLCDHLKAEGAAIGLSTVYRQLELLVDEGVLQKYVIDGNTPACFEYVGEHKRAETDPGFHCKCEKCGKLIHLHCEELSQTQDHLRKEHDFQINPMRMVFYGLCSDCLP